MRPKPAAVMPRNIAKNGGGWRREYPRSASKYPPLRLFLWRYDSSDKDSSEGSVYDSPDMQNRWHACPSQNPKSDQTRRVTEVFQRIDLRLAALWIGDTHNPAQPKDC